MKYRNIAVLVTGLDSDAQAETLKGIEQYGKANDCNIVVFHWFTGAFEREKHNMGELNIVNLPDFNLFDAVIVMSNALHVDLNKKHINDKLSDVECPIVTIGCDIHDSYSVYTDSYTAMEELVEHFIIDHKFTRIHFVKGIEGNPDAETRFRAYKDTLKKHNIPYEPGRVSQGDFYVTGGEQAANEILKSSLPFPEAIICANYIMAITVCDVLSNNGYKVPYDVVVAGYDYTKEGQYHYPSLTTVKTDFVKLGSEACKLAIDAINGCVKEKKIVLPDEVVLAESCGCVKEFDGKKIMQPKIYYSTEVAQRKMLYQMILLEKDIMEGEGFDDWCNSFKMYIGLIDPPEFYICVNEHFIEDVFESDAMGHNEIDVEEQLAYSEMSNVILAYKDKEFFEKKSFESGYALDDLFLDSEYPKTYVFAPLHYLERNFGYFVFVDSTFPILNAILSHWMINMGHALENIRKHNLLKNIMKELDELYVRDPLTGAYNRFGMERFFSEIKKKCIMSRLKLHLAFIDLDNLKLINDEFGHEEGDRIISQAAKILKTNAGKYYVVRYGGDEFIVLGSVRNRKEVENYWDKVQKEIDRYNDSKKKQAKLSLSVGYEIFDVGTETSLEDCISVADKLMYECKYTKKAGMVRD